MPSYSADELVRALRRGGFRLDRVRGSHALFERQDEHGTRTVVVPLGRRDMPKKTVHSILEQAGWSEKDLQRLLRR